MQKTSTSVSARQDNPQVLIRYVPENAPLVVAQAASKLIARIESVKPIKDAATLEALSETLNEASITSEGVELFVGALREQIQKACERVRELPGYEDFEATLTIRKWSLRQRLGDGIAMLKRARANFLAAEQERVNREQLAKQAQQDKINKEAADKAAAAAKKAGASVETVKEIKQAISEMPAPLVTSRALDTAAASGASVRYQYSAQITSIKSFLGFCLNNPVMLATLGAALPEIEKAFRKMASDQREAFHYPGITFKKTAVDVSRGAR